MKKMKFEKLIIASCMALSLVSLHDIQAAEMPTVQDVKLIRFSGQTIKVSWKAVKSAKYYHVYYQTGKGDYKLGRTTDKTYGLITKLKKNTNYKVYVTAGKTQKASAKDSQPSAVKTMKTKAYKRTIVFAGDSIVGCLHLQPTMITKMHSTANVKMVGITSINSRTFRTQRKGKGMTGIERVKSYHPYRVYFLLGLNEVCYRPFKDILADRKNLTNQLRKQNPNVDVVWCATPPVTKAEMKRAPHMRLTPALNKEMEKFAKKNHCEYLDYTAFLKDKKGFLKGKYATPDGFHWQKNACEQFGTLVGKYDKTLDD
ncbi:MAG TPA: hypothetical protein DCQ45_02605 [Erysipelotrichaceae bacterium]|nr:hypothetical protein [Erysipelotrichaceae bacterium]